MRVVVAPDKFKGSLSAAEVARALALGLRAVRPDSTVIEIPIADGGDGTVAAAVQAGYTLVTTVATGPTGRSIRAAFAVQDGTAVVELAEVVGLRRLHEGRPAPLVASTYGLGQVIRAALDHGVGTIIVGVGGSASTDGGAGMLQALGGRLLDSSGKPIGRGGGALLDLATVDISGMDPRLSAIRVLLASDVDNPLLGPDGSARVFGPQKGADAGHVELLESALANWAQVTEATLGGNFAAIHGGGAAGGTGFAALAYLGAQIVPGIELVLDLVGFDVAVDRADLVITGEGALDVQTLRGKGPLGVARAASRRGIPVVAVAGHSSLLPQQLAGAGISAAYALTSLEPDVAVCVANASALLEQVGRQIAEDWTDASVVRGPRTLPTQSGGSTPS